MSREKDATLHTYLWPVDKEKLMKSLKARAKTEKKRTSLTSFVEEAIRHHIEKWGIK